jgi:hypothetical protein
MVFKTRAGDLDLFDRRLPHRHLLSPVAFANQLPANPAGKIQLPESDFVVPGNVNRCRRPGFLLLSESNLHFLCTTEIQSAAVYRLGIYRPTPNLRKKINVKRVNC